MNNQMFFSHVSPILVPIVSVSLRQNRIGQGKRREGQFGELSGQTLSKGDELQIGGRGEERLNINRVISCSSELWPEEPSGT